MNLDFSFSSRSREKRELESQTLFGNGPRLAFPKPKRRPPYPASPIVQGGNLRNAPRSSCSPPATEDIRKLSKIGSIEMALSSELDGWTRDPTMVTHPLIENFGFSQMSNVQRSSRSGLNCRCVASDIDSTDVRISSPVRLNDLGRMIEILMGGANFIHGATGIVWLTGVSISLNAVSGLSAMGTTEMKMTAVTTRSRNVHSVRFTTLHTPMA